MGNGGALEEGVERAGGDPPGALLTDAQGGVEDLGQVLPGAGGGPDDGGPGDEAGAPGHLATAAVDDFGVAGDEVGLVEDEDDALLRVQGHAQDVLILRADVLGGVDDDGDDIGAADGGAGAADGGLLRPGGDAAAAADAGGVDQVDALAAEVEGGVDGVAGWCRRPG